MSASLLSSSPRTLEDRVILACARTDPDIHCIGNLVDRVSNWEGILRRTERFGLAPLVYASLRQTGEEHRVPKVVTERLRHLYHRDALSSITKREALRAILLQFREENIPTVVLKGAAMAALVYPSPALRTMGDVDLLVQKRDLEKADTLLRTMGYTLESARGFKPGSGADAHHEVPYLGPNGFPLVELHHHIFSSTFVRIPIDDFWQRARTAEVASVETLVFSNEDLLLHSALHLMVHFLNKDGFVTYVRSLCDIREMCRRFSNGIDWNCVIAQARLYQVEKHLYHVFRLARDLVGANVPAEPLAELRDGSPHLLLEERFIAAVLRRVALCEDETRLPPWTFYKISADLLSTRGSREGLGATGRQLRSSCVVRARRAVDRAACRLRRTGVPHKASKPARSSSTEVAAGAHAPGEIAVTYDQTPTDGVGAQLQRIYGLYALSRGLQIKYVHTPLGHVDYQGFLALLTGQSDPHFAERYNSFFSLPSDPFDTAECERVTAEHIGEDTVDRYREHAARTGRPVLLKGLSGYRYTDRHPEAYQSLREVSPYREHRADGPIRVCVHVRRADNSIPGRTDQLYRWLPNDYYLRLCGTVVDVLRRRNLPFVIRLHTEVPPRNYTLHPGLPGLFCTLDHPTTIGPADCALEEFDSLPNLEMVVNVEARESLDDFGTADVLVLSRSSFSYLGGLLNPRGLVIYAPWTHPPLPGWLVAGERGELDGSEFEARLAELLHHRSVVADRPRQNVAV